MRKIIATTLSSVLVATAANAAWQTVDDFEGYADQAALQAVWTEDADTDGSGGEISVVADPFDATNKVLRKPQGVTTNDTGGTYNHRAWRSIPAVVSGKATFYLRFAVPDILAGDVTVPGIVDEVWGLTPVDVPTGYGDYSALARIEFDGSFDVYNTTTYELFQSTMPDNTWYEFWYVLDHDTRTFDAYVKGGTAYPDMTKLNTTPFGYRNATIEPIDIFLLTSSAGTLVAPKGLDAMLIDDLSIDLAGENLTSPVDGGPSDAQLSNISTRGLVGTGGDIQIAGFVITGTTPKTVLIRAAGPSLGALGVPNTLADPVLSLFDSATPANLIASNDNWGQAANAADIAAAILAVGAFEFAANSLDAAILITLEPGAYTAQVSGSTGAPQVAIVEVYTVD